MQLNLTPFDANIVSWSKDKQLGVVEWSDLGGRDFDRLYDDAIDIGYAFRGKIDQTVWHLCTTIKNADNDTEVFVLLPTTETMRNCPQLIGWELHILND